MRLLDWRDPSHWGEKSKPCVHCGARTPLRDDKGRPAHKVCVETVLAEMFPDVEGGRP